jgi:uracil-DNA glycosylase
MVLNIHPSWKQELSEEFAKPYFKELTDFVDKEYSNHNCYPPKESVFAAFNSCPFEEVKLVIIGQDPYHGIGQANGLCFSVAQGISHPPSLINIFKELHNDLGIEIPKSGDLSRWAEQGVLLLNATLTVRAHEAGSHQKKGWESFTDAVISKLSQRRTSIIFLLWGGYAKKKGGQIDTSSHHVLTSGHPSPLSANRGYWFGNSHFKKANELLIAMGENPIRW